MTLPSKDMDTSPSPHPSPAHPRSLVDPRLVAALGMLGRLAPALAARAAEGLFARTSRTSPRPDEAAFLAQAVRFQVRVQGQRIVGYRWEAPGPTVLCTHGWWSHAGRFTPLAAALRKAGYRVVAFDAPGHGQSSGWRASMPEFARALSAVAATEPELHALVGHSLGGAASVYALAHGVTVRRAVVLAAPTDLEIWMQRFREAFDLTDDIYARMQANMVRRIGVTWEDIDVRRLATQLRIPGLIVHDTADPDVPWSEGQSLATAWPGATLHSTDGLGHHAILRHPAVVDRVVEFLDRDR